MDQQLARALLRLGMAVDFIVHGAVRMPILSKFADGLARDFAPTILPAPLVHAFALAVPFAEAALGLLLLIGLKQRAVLVAGALLMIVLMGGTALLQRWDVLTQQLIYLGVYAVLLATRSWDRWSLDSKS
ncbi:MAG TPA: MauE/DoxX family redox-associated membrane protein [Myxococcales bacterium]|jgi:thiosulfate dehydrogenase [quinone] large subunit|nr:MauE/DoxX family redox-associated membrane protein [Myxococcales bacterium]